MRAYRNWEGRFVGKAFEMVKNLQRGAMIDVTEGWIDNEEYTGRNDKTYSHYFVTISDFILSDAGASEMTPEELADYANEGLPGGDAEAEDFSLQMDGVM